MGDADHAGVLARRAVVIALAFAIRAGVEGGEALLTGHGGSSRTQADWSTWPKDRPRRSAGKSGRPYIPTWDIGKGLGYHPGGQDPPFGRTPAAGAAAA